MSCILNIETSTNVCSVSVSENGACIFNQEDHTGPNHNERLGKFVDEALSFAESHAIPLDAVAVSCGPGSYTGLRIGTSMAKGVCYGRGVSLVAIPTLELMCVPVLLQEMVEEENALLCPMIDARRMEVYAQLFDRSLHEVRPIQADVVDADTYREYLDERPVYFFGNGADRRTLGGHSGWRHPLLRHLHQGARRDARGLGSLAKQPAQLHPRLLIGHESGRGATHVAELRRGDKKLQRHTYSPCFVTFSSCFSTFLFHLRFICKKKMANYYLFTIKSYICAR